MRAAGEFLEADSVRFDGGSEGEEIIGKAEDAVTLDLGVARHGHRTRASAAERTSRGEPPNSRRNTRLKAFARRPAMHRNRASIRT
jgi:hypothetical protein